MLRLTFPIVRAVLWRHRLILVTFGLLSVLLGVVPTLKSELEAGIIDQANQTLRSREGRQPSDWHDLIPAGPLNRFESLPDDAGYPEQIARWVFKGTSFLSAVAVYLVVGLLAFGITFWSNAITARIGKEVFTILRGRGVRRGLAVDPGDVPSMPNAPEQYSTAIQQGALTIGRTYGYFLDAGQQIFALVTTIFLVITTNALFGVFCIAVISIQLVLSLVQGKHLSHLRTAFDRERNALSGSSDDIFAKREILLAYEQQERYAAKVDVLAESCAEVDRKLDVREQFYQGLGSLIEDYGRILIVVGALIAAIATLMIWETSNISTLGDVWFLISIYGRALRPATSLLWRYDSYRRSESISRTFLEVLNSPKLISAGNGAKDGWTVRADIEFRNVTFAYREEWEPVLKNCSFRIPAGKTTLLLGPSGCGKTTIARLLLAFWRPTAGQIAIGGKEIRDFTPHQVRLRMSYVAQADHIVDDSIGDNLSWAVPRGGISPEAMRNVLSKVGIESVKGYQDILAVPARELSIGQMQRLSVARMMLDESEVLILDEPLAGIDVFTLRDLIPELRRILVERQHTVLLISHRISMAGNVDHVVILDDHCNVIEEGNPKDLVQDQTSFLVRLHRAALADLRIVNPDAVELGPDTE